jgi:tetratricopeptide (TPR) repeat protein
MGGIATPERALTGFRALRNVSAMSKPSVITGLRGILRALCLGGILVSTTAAEARPYVETAPPRGFHLFTRPRRKTPEAQWEFVQSLDRANKTRAATRHALALRLFWPHSPEAPRAQLLHARLLERRGHPQESFDAYQHLVNHYPGRFEFNEVVARQMALAKTLMDQRKGRFLFLPGFTAPERAIPLFEQVAANAPEWSGTAEAHYLIGLANQRIYEYAKAIDAYFTTLNRFPNSEFAEPAAHAQVRCHILISEDSPQDNRAIETAIAACDLFLQRFPDSDRGADIQAARRTLREQQARNAFARARYYDRILRSTESAIIEYRAFLALHPDADQAPEARRRVEQLVQKREKQ